MTGAKAMIASFLMLTLMMAGAAAGQELDGTLKKIKSSGVFTLGYREAAPPFSFPGPDKRPVGYSIDLCMQVASAIQKQLKMENLKLEWVPVTAENRIDMVAQGKIDLECGTTTASLSRQERVDFSLMTFVDGGSLLTKADANLRGVGDLAGKRIAVMPGTTTETALAKFLKDEFITVQTVRVKDPLEGVAAIEKGQADAFASDRGILIGIAVTSKDPKRFGLANVLFSYEPYGLCCAATTGVPAGRESGVGRGLSLRRHRSHLRSLVRRLRQAEPGDCVHVSAQWPARIGGNP